MTPCARKPWWRLLVAAVGAIALAVIASGGCGEKDPCEKPYSCPESGYIDCGLPWTEEAQEICGGECHDWIVENCPEVKFAW